jgi:hypothetical protein
MSRYEILEEIDPDWRERYRGDVDLAWNFYNQFAREEIERIRQENAE